MSATISALRPRPSKTNPQRSRHGWTRQRQRLKTERPDAVLQALREHIEPEQTPDEDAPVRQCWRYLSHRLGQLDYQGAVRQGLPIGCGEIESAHRYLVQKRLKLPRAWCNEVNAEHMLALRINRANDEWHDEWHDYWATHLRYAA